ncbi:MAG: leucine-rich repeat domain-containing protein [Treponema sp.]|nr:leucine-rich repeat domain-containing protein [Candidatus Treponema equifaecale]
MTESKAEEFTIENNCVKKYNGNAEVIRVPAGITAISDIAFNTKESIKEVYLPETVSSIGKGAFSRCNNLEKVEMLGVKTIAHHAFGWCPALKEAVVSENLENLEDEAFSNCTNLTTLKLSQKIKVIPQECFSNCKNLKSIILPLGIKEIRKNAFQKCGLDELIIPNTTCKIQMNAFIGSSLTLKLQGPDFNNYKTNGSASKHEFVSMEEAMKYYPEDYKIEKEALDKINTFKNSVEETLAKSASNLPFTFHLLKENGKNADIYIRCGKRYAFLVSPLEVSEKIQSFIKVFCDYSKTNDEVIDAMKPAKIKPGNTKTNMNLSGGDDKEVVLFCKEINFFRPKDGITLEGCEKFTFTKCIQSISKESSTVYYYLRDKKEITFVKGSPFVEEFKKEMEYYAKTPGDTSNQNVIIKEE